MAEKKRILVVDDIAMMRGMLSAAIETAGYEVTTAENGLEAVSQVGFDRPDLILMDLDMPVLGGVSAIQAIRANPVLKHVPIIVVTAYGTYDVIRSAIDAGATDILVKHDLRIVTLLDDVKKRLMEADPLWDPAGTDDLQEG